jgi:hypothetical protein
MKLSTLFEQINMAKEIEHQVFNFATAHSLGRVGACLYLRR